jgi:hypothetical protein
MITSSSPTIEGVAREVENVEHELKRHEHRDEKMYGSVHHHHHAGMHPAELKDCIEDVVEDALEDIDANVEKLIESNTMKGHHMYSNLALPAVPAAGGFGFGGGGALEGILLGSLLFRGGLGGWGDERRDRGERGDFGTMEILRNENDNGRFADVNNRISAGNTALQAMIEHNSTLAGQARTDDMICGIEKDFFAANLAESERIANVRRDIADAKYDGALAELRTEAQIKDCCCQTERLVLDSRFVAEKTALENQSALQRQIDDVKCLIKENDLKDQLRIAELRNKELEGKLFVQNQNAQTTELKDYFYRLAVQSLSAAGIAAPA